MGNIDENRLSALLERINGVKVELEALENEVRGLCGTDGSVEILDSVARQDSPAIEAAAGPEVIPEEVPAAAAAGMPDIPEDIPIEIDIQDMDLPPIVEAPAVRQDDDMPFGDDLPGDESPVVSMPDSRPEPKEAIIDSQKARTAVMDVMAENQAWRKDRPGSQVKNVISAISLNDRVLLINVLFREDPILFQDTISAFNGMSNLDEAIAYIQTNFPDWDLNSEPVYRLMMAVRRRLG